MGWTRCTSLVFVVLILAIGIYPALLTGTIQRGISPIVKLIGG